MGRLQTTMAQVGAAWSAIPIGRRMMMGVVVLAGIAGVVIFALVGGPRMSPLMTELSPEDVSAITSRLTAQNIPYELTGGGSAILVPDDKVLTTRLALASEGLPKGGGVGFELFDETKLGRSRFEERLSYQRALEGELRRTIQKMSGVRDARVHLALPERSIFKERDRQPRASVTLQLAAGRKIAGESVQAVVHLVASSVEGLSADSVTVVDTTGAVLASGDGTHEVTGKRLEHQREIEDGLEQRATAMLERTVGPGGATVRVNAEIDYAQVETTSETFDPDATVLRSEQTADESRSSNSPDVGGIPGSRSNLAGTTTGVDQVAGTSITTQGVAGNGVGTGGAQLPSSQQNRKTLTRNYEVSKTVSREISATGKVVRLSVAVLVDGKHPKEGGDVTPRSREELDQLSELVKTAVGFDGRRGDHIEVQSAAFVDAMANDPVPPTPVMEMVERSARPAAAGVVALAAIIAALVVMKRAKQVSAVPRAALIRSPMTVRELEAAMNAPAQATVTGVQAMPAGAGVAAGLPNAKPDAARAAGVIKGWLAES